MNISSYQALAQSYADGVRGLFAAPSVPSVERGERMAMAPQELADRAAQLSPVSTQLTQTTADLLADTNPDVRIQSSTRLLAKALTDLQVSTYLLQAAQDEESGITQLGPSGAERGSVSLGAIEDYLQLLLSEDALGPSLAERGQTKPTSIPMARMQLSHTVTDALTLILDRASKTAQKALGGVLGLGVAELAQAAGLVGMDIARELGQAEIVTRLYSLFREFVINSYNSVLSLLGQQVAQAVSEQVLEWVNEIRYGRLFSELLEMLYQTKQTGEQLGQVVNDSSVNLEKFVTAIEGVDGLNDRYGQQVDLIDKLLKGVRFLGAVSAAILPLSRLLVAAVYILLGGYVVLSGADYVDAQKLTLLARVPGVRQVVESNLASI
jgi:hypothetical protein